MRIVKPSVTLISYTPDPLKIIEACGRICYKSEDQITPESAVKFTKMLLGRHHDSVTEHAVVTLLVICDRGVSHEIVRHRIASYSQESTRYVSSVDPKQFNVTDELDVIESYESGLSMKRIAAMSSGKYTEWDVYTILEECGVDRRPKGNHGIVHHNFFDEINTPEKAYLLGLIQADGSLRSEGSPQITITQKKSVSWYIQRMIKNLIKPSAKRGNDRGCHSVSIVSDRMHERLINIGIVPNKSYDQTKGDVDRLWAAIPTELIPSFLRGFLDGDGSIRFFKQNNVSQTDSCSVVWNGNKHILTKIQEWLAATFKYRAEVKPHSQSPGLYRVYVTKPEVGEQVVRRMLQDFVFPYGHPAKTARMIERVGGEYATATWGDQKFNVVNPLTDQPFSESWWIWMEAMDASEEAYTNLREAGCTAQIARSVLPTCLKTEIAVTMNFREWRHFLTLRLASAAHPQMREVAAMARDVLVEIAPALFEEFK